MVDWSRPRYFAKTEKVTGGEMVLPATRTNLEREQGGTIERACSRRKPAIHVHANRHQALLTSFKGSLVLRQGTSDPGGCASAASHTPPQGSNPRKAR